MKKTATVIISAILALMMVCTISVIGFAKVVDESTTAPTTKATDTTKAADTTKATPTTDPQNAKNSTTKKAEESTTKKSAEDLLKDLSSAVDKLGSTTLPNSVTEDNADVVTNPSGVTAVQDDDATSKAAVSSTRKAAAVSSRVPNTGSSVVAPVVALLALAAGTVAVVKTKKNED